MDEDGDLNPVGALQLGEDPRHIGLHGGEAHEQRGGDVRVRWAALRGHVHLQADAADRHAALEQPAHERVHVVGLAAEALRAVVVVHEERGRVGRVSGPEGLLQVAFPELLEEDRVAQPAAVGHGLVDHVP